MKDDKLGPLHSKWRSQMKNLWGCNKLTVDTFHYQDVSWLCIDRFFQKSKIFVDSWINKSNIFCFSVICFFAFHLFKTGRRLNRNPWNYGSLLRLKRGSISCLKQSVINHILFEMLLNLFLLKPPVRRKKGAKEEPDRRNRLIKSNHWEEVLKLFWLISQGSQELISEDK